MEMPDVGKGILGLLFFIGVLYFINVRAAKRDKDGERLFFFGLVLSVPSETQIRRITLLVLTELFSKHFKQTCPIDYDFIRSLEMFQIYHRALNYIRRLRWLRILGGITIAPALGGLILLGFFPKQEWALSSLFAVIVFVAAFIADLYACLRANHYAYEYDTNVS